MTTAVLRPLLRIARRDMARHKGRTILITTLIGLPVGAALIVGMLLRQPNVTGDGVGYWAESALLRLEVATADAQTLESNLGTTSFARVDSATALLPASTGDPGLPGGGGLPVTVIIETFDPSNPLEPRRYQIVDGVAPTGAGELAISESLADLRSLAVGDPIQVYGLGQQTIVGIAHVREQHDFTTLLTSPEQPLPAAAELPNELTTLGLGYRSSSYYLATDPGDFGRFANNVSASYRRGSEPYPSNDQFFTDPTVIALLAGTGLLCVTGLIAAAAFATANRRRIRDFGLLSATGAEPGQITTLALVEAGLLGTVGAVIGATVAVIGFNTVGVGLLTANTNSDAIAVFAPRDVVVTIVVGIGAAMLAAWFPARTVAAVSTQTALAGRIPLRSPSRWTAPLGLATGAAGLSILAVWNDSNSGGDRQSLALIVGIVLGLGGAALLGGPIVSALGRLAARLPIGPRLVLRDNARQRTRTAAAVGALTAMFVIPVVALALIGTEQRSNQLTFPGTTDSSPFEQANRNRIVGVVLGLDQELSPAQLAPLDDIAAVEQIVTWTQLSPRGDPRAFDPWTGGPSFGAWDEALAAQLGLDQRQLPIDSPNELRAVQLVPGSLDWPPQELIDLYDSSGNLSVRLQVTSVSTDLVVEPAMFLLPDTATSLGLEPAYRAGVIQLAASPDAATIDQIRNLTSVTNTGFAAQAGIDLPPLSYGGYLDTPYVSSTNFDAVKAIVVGLAFVSGLLVLAVTAALVSTESDNDLATMVAVGGAPGLRRSFLARQTFSMAAIAAAVALPFGLLGARALADPGFYGNFDFTVPWLWVAVLLVGTPVVASAVIGTTMRSKAVTPLRRLD